MKRCLIIYPFFANYRLPILKSLTNSRSGWEYELLGDKNPIDGIKGIDPKLADISTKAGGLCWKFTRLYYPFTERIPFTWQSGVISRLLKKDYDAVIFLGSIYHLSYIVAIPILKIFKIPIIFWTHGFLGKDSRPIFLLRHFLYSQADAIMLYGNRAKKYFKLGDLYKKCLISVIYNSLDYSGSDAFNYTEEQISEFKNNLFENELPVVVAVGRLTPVKRIDKLIKALHESIVTHNMYFNVLILGTGESLGQLRELVNRHKLNRFVNFVGAVYGDEVYKYLKIADLSVIPGNVGLSAMHSLSAGVPVISHDNFDAQMPEHEAIVEGITGSFYKENSIENLVEKIHAWIFNKGACLAAKENCLKIIKENYSVENQLKLIEMTLEELYRESKNQKST